jgi:hypothetical protein
MQSRLFADQQLHLRIDRNCHYAINRNSGRSILGKHHCQFHCFHQLSIVIIHLIGSLHLHEQWKQPAMPDWLLLRWLVLPALQLLLRQLLRHHLLHLLLLRVLSFSASQQHLHQYLQLGLRRREEVHLALRRRE